MAPLTYAPSLEKFLKSLKGQSLEASVEALVYLLKMRQVTGDACASATAHILLQVVAKSRWQDVDQLLANVQRFGSKLARAAPQEPVIGNIVRRVLGLIRDEAAEDRNADEFGSDSVSIQADTKPTTRPGPAPMRALTFTASSFQISKSMFNLLSAVETTRSGAASPTTGASTPTIAQPASVHALRSEVIDGIEEIMDEISQADDQIAASAETHIQPGDYILAYQPTPSVEKFLVKAASKRRFTVLFAGLPERLPREEPPHATLRKKLDAAGVKTISLASNGVMAYMPKINRVILGAKCVFHSGGILASGGSAAAARAAQEHAKPVLVLAGVFKFSPEYPLEDDILDHGNPSDWVDYADGAMVDAAEVENVIAEFVPPEQIDLYLTNLGAYTRYHIPNIVADHYKPEDMDITL